MSQKYKQKVEFTVFSARRRRRRAHSTIIRNLSLSPKFFCASLLKIGAQTHTHASSSINFIPARSAFLLPYFGGGSKKLNINEAALSLNNKTAYT
jgi:hypothetical protein